MQATPAAYPKLLEACKKTGFDMPADIGVGTLLKTLVTSKPQSNILELGTGLGISLCWMIAGMDDKSTLTTVELDPQLIKIVQGTIQRDPRVNYVCSDGAEWIKDYQGPKFDLIFADSWPGKYSELDETLELVSDGGYYIIDDMSAQPNWPDGHQDKANYLISRLEARPDFGDYCPF